MPDRFTQPPHLAAALIYALMAFGLLAPMASNTVIPEVPDHDHVNHIGHIVQARQAMEEGQFPIRVGPYEHAGFRYPLFQFYSPLVYTAGGLIYKAVTPTNPFAAYKILLWLGLVVGGFGIYRTANFLTGSRPAALVAGAMYMTAPYLLSNVHARGALTEVMAQAVLPVTLYCSLRAFHASWRSIWVLLAAIAWAALVLTHTITFLCSALFIGLLILLLAVDRRGLAGGLWRVGAAFALGCLLAMYQLGPVATADYLHVRSVFLNVGESRVLTPLSTLLSPISLPFEPIGASGRTLGPVYPSLGWPMLMGVGLLAYARWSRRGEPEAATGPRPIRTSLALVGLFLLAVFIIWSPIDFWSSLPRPFHVVQFTGRFFTQALWTGALATAYAIVAITNGRVDLRVALPAIILVMAMESSYLPALASAKQTPASIAADPEIDSRLDYLADPVKLSFDADGGYAANLELPFVADDRALKLDEPFTLPAALFRDAPRPELYLQAAAEGTGVLTIAINDRPAMQLTIQPGPLELTCPLPPGARVTFSISAKTTRVVVSRLILRGLAPAHTAVPLRVTQPAITCIHLEGDVHCHITIPPDATLVQLPVLFTPDMVDVRVNGSAAPVVPLRDRHYVLAGLRLSPGSYDVRAHFRGLAWANVVSLIAVLATLSGIIAVAQSIGKGGARERRPERR